MPGGMLREREREREVQMTRKAFALWNSLWKNSEDQEQQNVHLHHLSL
jgi:hypothetical protein